ncbi:MAG: IclR family transcriptional regulator C-terminal domain-containing protein [Pseudomonadota bacterium]
MEDGLRVDTRSETVGSFEKGLRVMRVMADADKGMTQAEVAEATGLTRASARRFLLTLIDLGYAKQVGSRVELTAEVLALGGVRFDGGLVWEMARPHLEDLSAELDESVSVAVRDGHDIVYAARAQARRIMSVTLNVGSRLPAIMTSMGRVILADLSVPCQYEVIEGAPPQQLTPHTRTDPDEIVAELARVRDQGYALSDQELEIGLRSIAVPIRAANGKAYAGLNVAVQASRVSSDHMVSTFVPALRRTAMRIEALSRLPS